MIVSGRLAVSILAFASSAALLAACGQGTDAGHSALAGGRSMAEQPKVDLAAQAQALAAADAAVDGNAANATVSVSTVGATTDPSPRQWFAANVDFTSCHQSHAPADRIQQVRDQGQEARVTERNDGPGGPSVEVSYSSDNGLQETFTTFYRSQAGCEAALAAQNAIPDKYR
jgi:hypothetical protein